MKLKKSFIKAVKIVRINRNYALVMFLVMVLFAVFGFIMPGLFADEQKLIIKEIANITAGKGFIELALVIIVNNLRAALVGIILGIFFGIVPFFAAAMNGYFLGAVMNSAWKAKGAHIFLLVLPHGIFEIPALAIAFGLGLKFGLWFREKRKWAYVKKGFADFMLVYFFIILPLLILAGFIESWLIALLG